jgi:hypothetical protein
MNWLLRKLGAAVVAGVGWKLGSDAYEYVKRRINEKRGAGAPAEQKQEGERAPEGPEVVGTARGIRR